MATEAQKRYNQSDKGKAARAKAAKRYAQSTKGKAIKAASRKLYEQSDKGKLSIAKAAKKYAQSDNGKALKLIATKRYLSSDKGKVMLHRTIIKQKYGITGEQYNELLIKQKGKCAICRKVCSRGKRLAIDHNHITGKVRGLLCSRCNLGLGNFMDNIAYLMRAADYLDKDDAVNNEYE